MYLLAQLFESEITRPWVPYHWVDLKIIGIVTGSILSIMYLMNIILEDKIKKIIPKLPRNKALGIILLSIATLWFYLIINEAHLGEFYTMRLFIFVSIPTFYILIIIFVDEFLAARSIGILLLLISPILLDASFLQIPTSRLLLVILAYVMIIKGLFLVSKPYLMRDKIDWLLKISPKKWRLLNLFGLCYGITIIVCAILFW